MRRLRSALGWTLVLLLISGTLYGVFGLMGVRIYRVDNGSMVPTLPVGTIVFDRPGTPSKNDIVTFRNRDPASPEGITSHVFGGYTKDGHLRTRGVANLTEDNFTPAPNKSDIKGIVMFQLPIFAPAFWLGLRGGVLALLIVLLAFILWSEEKLTAAASHEEAEEPRAPDPV